MMFSKTIIAILMLFSGFNAQAAASNSMNSTGIQEAVNSGANGAYGSEKAARCSSKRYHNCIKAALGFAQMGMSLMQMMQTMGSRDSLSPGTDWRNTALVNDFGPISPGDANFMDPVMDAIRSGTYADYLVAQKKLTDLSQPSIDLLAQNGVTFDAQAGTITTSNGTQNLSDLASLGADGNIAAYEDRLIKAMGLDTSGGGGLIMASSGAANGASNRSLSSVDSGLSVDSFLSNLDKGKVDQNKVAGLSTNTKDGTPIGVSMGNLFRTMQLKYDNLETNKEFK